MRPLIWCVCCLIVAALAISAPSSRARQHHRPRVRTIFTSVDAYAGSLDDLAKRGDVIARVNVAAVLRQETSPPNAVSTITPPHTVYLTTVEECYRGDYAVGSSLKVYGAGAILGDGVTVVQGVPFLQVGRSYILFLNDRSAEGGVFASDDSGVVRQSGFPDELTFAAPEHAIVMLGDDGLTHPASDEYQTLSPPPFLEGDPLFEVPQDQAVTSIQSAVKRAVMEASTELIEPNLGP